MQVTELSILTHKLRKNNNNYKLNWKFLFTETKVKLGVETCRLWLNQLLLILETKDNGINKRIN